MLVVYCVSWLIITSATVKAEVEEAYSSHISIPTESELMVTGVTCAYNKGRAGYMNETFVYLDRDDVPEKDVINFAGVFDFSNEWEGMFFQGIQISFLHSMYFNCNYTLRKSSKFLLRH